MERDGRKRWEKSLGIQNWIGIGSGKRCDVNICGNLREKMEKLRGKVRDWGLVVVCCVVCVIFCCFVFREMIGF